MSECVVRMNNPDDCLKCGVRHICNPYVDYWQQDTRKKPKPGQKGCLIICSLPEGYGDLIDRDALIDMVKTEDIALYTCFDSDDAYYSVTDLITILMMQKEIIKAKRKVDASDAVAPTDTPTDTPTVPAERSET